MTPTDPTLERPPQLIAAPPALYTLSDLIDAEALARLAGDFSNLCDTTISICDEAGARIAGDAAGEPVLDPAAFVYSAPVTWNGHVLGQVTAILAEPDARMQQRVELVADILAELCRKEAHIRRRVSELTTVYDLGGLFAGSTDLPSILNAAARRICEVMKVKAANVRLLDESKGELFIMGSWNLSAQYLNKGPVKLVENPIDNLAFRGEVVYIEDAGADPRVRFPEHARAEGIVSGLCAPMTYRGHTVGVIRAYTGHKRRFTQFETDLLRAVASQAAGAVVNSRLIAERLHLERQQRQLHHAAQVQRQMIPSRPPLHGRVTFGQIYEPSLELGGDFFDFVVLPNGNIGLSIADVVGKGLPGALMMASVRSALRAHAHSIFDLNEIVSLVNRLMCRDTNPSEFATLFYGVFSPDGDRFTYCNAGHNPPLLLRGDRFIPLDVGGMVIGVYPNEPFERQVLQLESGDVIVFYTDGITEALNFQGEAYGEARLEESIRRYRELPAQTLATQLLWDVRRFVGLARQTDDITIVTAKVA